MTRDMKRIFWMTNKEWYTCKNGKFELTPQAPPEAQRSFAEWQRPHKKTFRGILRDIRSLFY